MGIHIHFTDEHLYISEDERHMLTQLLETAAREEELEEGEISILFVSNEEIRELNKTYREKDQVTDVLSFPMYTADEDMEVPDETEPLLLGDIVISVPKAKEQAEQLGHSFPRELGFLAVHGFLHLLGYDHEEVQMEKEMFSLQEKILIKHGLVR